MKISQNVVIEGAFLARRNVTLSDEAGTKSQGEHFCHAIGGDLLVWDTIDKYRDMLQVASTRI